MALNHAADAGGTWQEAGLSLSPRRKSWLTLSALGVLALCGGVGLGLLVLPALFTGGSLATVVRQDGPVVAVVVIALGLGYYFGVDAGRTAAERNVAMRQALKPLPTLPEGEIFAGASGSGMAAPGDSENEVGPGGPRS